MGHKDIEDTHKRTSYKYQFIPQKRNTVLIRVSAVSAIYYNVISTHQQTASYIYIYIIVNVRICKRPRIHK